MVALSVLVVGVGCLQCQACAGKQADVLLWVGVEVAASRAQYQAAAAVVDDHSGVRRSKSEEAVMAGQLWLVVAVQPAVTGPRMTIWG